MKQEFEQLLEMLVDIRKKGHDEGLPFEVSEALYNLERALTYLKHDKLKLLDLTNGQIALYLAEKGYSDSNHNIGVVRLEVLEKKQRMADSPNSDYELLKDVDLAKISYLEERDS